MASLDRLLASGHNTINRSLFLRESLSHETYFFWRPAHG